VSGAPDDGRREHLTVTPDDAGSRLDVFLATRLPALSRSEIQRLIRTGHITAGPAAVKPSLIVTPGLAIDVTLPRPVPATPRGEALPVEILHDDPDFVVVNKPAGMVVHPAAGHAGGTLVNALVHHFGHVGGLSGVGGEARPGIVHRLDRGTSGVMVIAKNDLAHRHLTQQFHDRTVIKHYQALVWGRPARGATMTQPIGRDPRNRLRMSSRAPRGRTAETTVVDVEPLGAVSLIRVRIGTGRTHQIRVHLSEAGHPVVGDVLYGGARRDRAGAPAVLATVRRPMLHAADITFGHPRRQTPVSVVAEIPEDLAQILAMLREAQGSETSAVPKSRRSRNS
jgi:23S rRNA pseudouridine1911/1915/1917 synthase